MFMQKTVLISMAFGFFVACQSSVKATNSSGSRNPNFVAKRATEARLTFSHFVEMDSASKPTMDEATEQIEEQVLHLFGPMERSKASAAPKEDHIITNKKIRKKPDTKNTYQISYDYSGTIVLEVGPKKFYEVYLPINPSKIFARAQATSGDNCTDHHYNSEGDFWYFWSPAPFEERESCKLVKDEDYSIVQANIERIDNDVPTTYPEYDRLPDQNGLITIDIYFGMDDPKNSHDPYSSKDINAETFRATTKSLKDLGFTITPWTDAEINKIATFRLPKDIFVQTARKSYPNRKIEVAVRMFFGETGLDEDSKPFHYFLRDSLANASIMIYDGHSGLGGHLDLDAIAEVNRFKKPIVLNKKRYQIYFFNSCTSYTYYNALYFREKVSRRAKKSKFSDSKGTKNLDILANGLSTSFDVMQNNDLTLISAVDTWAGKGQWTSYKGLAKRIDSDNLFTVNGDEDNPPPKR